LLYFKLADSWVLIPMKFKRLTGDFDPRAAFLHPFCRSTTVLRNQTANVTDAFAFGDDP
jgi:hypothetical protein